MEQVKWLVLFGRLVLRGSGLLISLSVLGLGMSERFSDFHVRFIDRLLLADSRTIQIT